MTELIARVKALLFTPKTELPKTLAEPGELKSVLMPYVAVLAAIGPIATFISTGLIGVYVPAQKIFGMTVGGGFVRQPVLTLVMAIVTYAIAIGAWWFYGFLLAALAPSFGGRKDMGGGLKAAAYSLTPLWVAGALNLLKSVPFIGILATLAMIAALVYSVMIGIWAVPVLVGTPSEKAPGHTLASLGIVVVTVAVVYVIVGAVLVGALVGAMMH